MGRKSINGGQYPNQLSLGLDDQTLEAIRESAKAKGVSVNEAARDLIRKGAENERG